ncbi:MAG: SUMF1/EgtB/PvdO family nonheme iron enzyme, partial [bacterium]|nr:SUMF1/EgtB/PvdO family nonheme iron enzyme [bacterium]
MEGRHHLAGELAEARARTDELFSMVHPDSMFERPVPERHRLNFYLGHMEAFDWNIICRHALSVPAFEDTFDQLFAFGIDPDESGLPNDVPADWPTLRETHAYNARVRETVDRLLHEAPEQIVHVAIEHRLMHAETLCYLLHNLDPEEKIAPESPEPRSGESPEAETIEIPAGTTCLGRARNGAFGWDNEFEQLRVEVPAFAVGKHKVTNGDYLRFVLDGAQPPFFWSQRKGEWKLRTMFGEIQLPLDWPVWGTRHEAQAYAKAAGESLPTEAQLDRAGYA